MSGLTAILTIAVLVTGTLQLAMPSATATVDHDGYQTSRAHPAKTLHMIKRIKDATESGVVVS